MIGGLKLVKFVYLVIVLWSILSMQSWIEVSNGNNSTFIDQFRLFLSLIIECLAVVLVLTQGSKIKCNTFGILVFVYVLYLFIVTIVNKYNHSLVDFVTIAWWPSCYYIFYVLFSNYPMFFIKNLERCVIYLLVTVLILFSIGYNQLYTIQSAIYKTNISIVSNQIFYILLLLPWLFILDKKIIRYILFLLCFICVIISAKRSAIINVAVIGVLMIYSDNIHKSRKWVLNSIGFFFLLFVFFASFLYIDSALDSSVLSRFESLQEDKGSGRGDIIPFVLASHFEKPFEEILVGSGFNGVIQNKIVGDNSEYLSSHNDFVEIIYDFGLFGFVIYFCIFILLIGKIRAVKQLSSKLYFANLSAFCIVLIMSQVSHLWLYPSFYIYISILWGITDGFIIYSNKKV